MKNTSSLFNAENPIEIRVDVKHFCLTKIIYYKCSNVYYDNLMQKMNIIDTPSLDS